MKHDLAGKNWKIALWLFLRLPEIGISPNQTSDVALNLLNPANSGFNVTIKAVGAHDWQLAASGPES